ncbi:MAG: CMP-N-acetylneuraminic acid synthetase [Crocinitomicaceae bacterium]|jgi:CMP-N-acetylneuraminic acid synthetase
MIEKKIIALVPIRQVSTRLENKNFRLLDGKPLYQHILDTLHSIDSIDQVIINTDSDIIKEACSTRYSKVRIIDRPNSINGPDITMNTLINYDLSQVEGEHFFQTHATNPLLTSETIIDAIQHYFERLGTKDSLLSVYPLKKRLYQKNLEPINHQNGVLAQTQDLPEVLVENSNIFIFSRTSFFENHQSRIGSSPFAFYMNELEGIDIDTGNDLALAELICQNRTKSLREM